MRLRYYSNAEGLSYEVFLVLATINCERKVVMVTRIAESTQIFVGSIPIIYPVFFFL